MSETTQHEPLEQPTADLSNLHDIVTPEAISLWPPQWGVWVAIGLWVIVGVLAGRVAYRHSKANAYRRQALREFNEIIQTNNWCDLPALIKRTALVAWPRAEVAGLTGETWAQWLNAHGGRFSSDHGEELHRLAYANANEASTSLQIACKQWLQNHRRRKDQ